MAADRDHRTSSGQHSRSHRARQAYVADRYSKWFDFQAVEDLLGPARGRQVQVKGDKGFQRFNPDSAYRYAKVDQGGLRITVVN